MSEIFYSVNLAGLPILEFQTKQEVEEWLNAELQAWSWLWNEESVVGSLGVDPFKPLVNSFRNISANLANVGRDGHLLRQQNGQNFDNPFRSLFAGRGQQTLFASESLVGRRIFSIRDKVGVDAARWYLMFATGQRNLQNVTGIDDLALIVGSLAFDESWAGEVGETLKGERTRYRSEITKLENRVRQLEAERRDDRARLSAAMRRQASNRLNRYKRIWESGKANIAQRVDAAVGSISETEDMYRRQMALRAPVQYWRAKATIHGYWEACYAIVTLVFFGAAAVGILFMAEGAIDFLRDFKGENETSAYIITSAALLAGTTLIFWLGRVIVKLFLSEHHLRGDCSEKAVMTEAFLAMAEEDGSMAETERAIILASVFRSSPDGIVKEDGPVDFGAAAILGKALSR